MAGFPNAQSNPGSAIPVWLAGAPGVPPGLSLLGFTPAATLVSSTDIFAAAPAGTLFALVQVNSGIVRYRRDGTPPTGANGMLMYATGPSIAFQPSANLRFIQSSEGAATINIEFYGVAS